MRKICRARSRISSPADPPGRKMSGDVRAAPGHERAGDEGASGEGAGDEARGLPPPGVRPRPEPRSLMLARGPSPRFRSSSRPIIARTAGDAAQCPHGLRPGSPAAHRGALHAHRARGHAARRKPRSRRPRLPSSSPPRSPWPARRSSTTTSNATSTGAWRAPARRPTASGRIGPRGALVAGLGAAAAGVLALWAVAGGLAALLALAGVAYYVVVYTLVLKPHMALSSIPGSLAGVFPALIGWAATGAPPSGALLFVCALIVVWSPPHFWALALAREDDYDASGVPTPVARYGARRHAPPDRRLRRGAHGRGRRHRSRRRGSSASSTRRRPCWPRPLSSGS